jgi:superfamily II DNA/RNA helicase
MIHKDSLNLFKSLSSILNSCTVSVFSATLNREVEKILGMFKDFTKIYLSNKGSISHKFVFGTKDQIKHLSLEQIIEEGVEVPCLVFVNSKEIGIKLSERIPRSAFFDNSTHLLDDFRLKKIWFLFTTDILSRGVDFINTKSVINYDFPRNKTIFIHRAGRVNRNTTGQKVITIYTVEDFKKLKEIVEILKENGSRVEEHIEKLYKV